MYTNQDKYQPQMMRCWMFSKWTRSLIRNLFLCRSMARRKIFWQWIKSRISYLKSWWKVQTVWVCNRNLITNALLMYVFIIHCPYYGNRFYFLFAHTSKYFEWLSCTTIPRIESMFVCMLCDHQLVLYLFFLNCVSICLLVCLTWMNYFFSSWVEIIRLTAVIMSWAMPKAWEFCIWHVGFVIATGSLPFCWIMHHYIPATGLDYIVTGYIPTLQVHNNR